MEQSPSWEANWFSAAGQEIPSIFGTRRFITVLTSARQLSPSWANSTQSPQPPPTSWRSVLILSSHLRLGLPNGLFPSGFPTRKTLLQQTNIIFIRCTVHILLFCTMTNKCTIISQIITLLHVNYITNRCSWYTCVTWQGIDYKLTEDHTTVSKHVGV